MAFHHARLTAEKVESLALANRDDACVVGAAPAPSVVDNRKPSDAPRLHAAIPRPAAPAHSEGVE